METELTKLKLTMLCDKKFTFFITILLSLDLIIDDTQPTAYTDGKSIGLNTDFWGTLSDKEKIFLLLHEVMHVALNHVTRLGNREHRRFNAACDYAINYDLVDAGYSMPKCGLYDKQYKDLTAEQIYELLPEGDDYDEEDIRFSDKPELANEIEEILVRAGAAAQLSGSGIGCIPSSAQRLLDSILNPKLPWQVLLQDLMLEHSTDDYSMEFPDEEYMPSLYVPTLYSEGMGEINFYCDVSGSVSQKDLDVTLAEVNSMRRTLEPSLLTLISFDTKIHLEVSYATHDYVDMSGIDMQGGGGTSVVDVYTHIKDTNPEIAVIVTDGHFNNTETFNEENTNVIWLILNNDKFTSNVGRVIHIETKDY